MCTVDDGDEEWRLLSPWTIGAKLAPIVILVLVVLGGIYGGVVTPVEAGAAGSLCALAIGVILTMFVSQRPAKSATGHRRE